MEAPAGPQLCCWGKCVREHPPCCPFPASGLSFESASPRMHRQELEAEVIYSHDLGAFLAPWGRDGSTEALSALGTGGMDLPL